MKIRIRFRKYGVMKFIGHLDVMRYFQKAMRRAPIESCYSGGFSPHQSVSFARRSGCALRAMAIRWTLKCTRVHPRRNLSVR